MDGYQHIEDVLKELGTTMASVQLGLEDFQHGGTPARKVAGLRNVIVWGRAVTSVFQQIRTFNREGFNKWYGPFETEMEENAVLNYRYELRSRIPGPARADPQHGPAQRADRHRRVRPEPLVAEQS